VSVFQEFVRTSIPGCYLIRPWRHLDNRGLFVKTFHAEAFREHGLETDFREDFYSVSHKGVLRGMHLQSPPYHQAKLVYCAKGRILDAVVDLRSDSQGFGTQETLELSDENGWILYIPPGVAHGFYVLSDEAITAYRVTVEYCPEADGGVRWDSCGIAWPNSSPIVSARDMSLPPLADARNLFTGELSRERR
jgi:dTDP-4-dehydrorhamnose 3,5-epimerase